MLAQFPLETRFAKVAEDNFRLEAGTPGRGRRHRRKGNSIERHVTPANGATHFGSNCAFVLLRTLI
jgi:hypothetical protein